MGGSNILMLVAMTALVGFWESLVAENWRCQHVPATLLKDGLLHLNLKDRQAFKQYILPIDN